MLNEFSTVTNADKLIKALEELATKVSSFDQRVASRLRYISNQISNDAGEELHGFAPHLVLDPDTLQLQAETYYSTRWRWINLALGVIDWLRNVLVFVPILVTWRHLSMASQHYATLLEQRPELRETPFLLLWQRKFEGLSSDSFSDVAGDVVLLMVGIVVLTFLVHLSRDVVNRFAEKPASAVRGEAEEVLWLLNIYLIARTYVHNQKLILGIEAIAKQTGILLHEVKLERERINAIARDREQQLDSLRTLGDSLKSGSHNMLAYGEQIGKLFRDLEGAIAKLARQHEQQGDQYSRLTNSIDRYGISIDEAVKSLRISHERLERTLSEVNHTGAAATRTQGALIDALSHLEEVAKVLQRYQEPYPPAFQMDEAQLTKILSHSNPDGAYELPLRLSGNDYTASKQT